MTVSNAIPACATDSMRRNARRLRASPRTAPTSRPSGAVADGAPK